jgi:hypothetical protein
MDMGQNISFNDFLNIKNGWTNLHIGFEIQITKINNFFEMKSKKYT